MNPPPVPVAPPAAVRRTPVWFVVLQAFLWLGVLGLLGFAIFAGLDTSNSTARSMREVGVALAIIIGLWAGLGALTLLLALRWRWVVILPSLFIGLPMLAAAFGAATGLQGEFAHRQLQRDIHSGKDDFGDQPALFAVANAIARHDDAGVRVAASKVSDLQARGQKGRTLLEFAVDEAMKQPALVPAIKTLLALGADPNFPGGKGRDKPSVALALAVSGPVELLRAMLDAGGDPNAHDGQDRPIIFDVWQYGYNAGDRRAALDLLLARGADKESALPATVPYEAGYPLLLCRAENGISLPGGYADALHLLELGADPRHAATDGMTLATLLAKHRRSYATDHRPIPPEYDALCAWLTAHGVTIPAESEQPTPPANASP